MIQKNEVNDYRWNTVGVFLQNLISPALLILVTHINGFEIAGTFSFVFAASILFWAFSMWGGRTYQVSDVKKEFSLKSYIMVRAVLSVLTLVIACVFSALNHYSAQKFSLLLILVGFKLIESLADSVYGILQVHSRLYVAGKSLSFKAVVGLLLFVAVDMATHNIVLSSIMLVAVNAVIFVGYDVQQAGRLEVLTFVRAELRFLLREATQIIKKCAPIFLIFFFAMFSLYIPRYFVDRFHEEQTGYFSILSLPVTLLVLLVSFILQPNLVKMSKLYASSATDTFNRYVYKLVGVAVGFGVVALLGSALVGVPVLSRVFGVSFAQYKTTLLMLVVGATLNAAVGIYINILVVMRKIRVQLYILIISNVLLAVASYDIVVNHGINGAVGLFNIVSLIQFVALDIYYRYALGQKKHEKN